MPVTTHAPSTSAGELAVRAMSASTRKMPDPIMEPATSAVELKRPSVCTMPGALDVPDAGFSVDVSLGVATGLVLYEFRAIVPRIFSRSLLLPETRRFIQAARATAETQLPGRARGIWLPIRQPCSLPRRAPLLRSQV